MRTNRPRCIVLPIFTAVAIFAATTPITLAQDPGSLDPAFDSSNGANAQVTSIAIHPNGTVVIGGQFTNYQGSVRGGVAQVLSNGLLDTAFDSGSGALLTPTAGGLGQVAVQPDGKVLIGGVFLSVQGVGRAGIARLETNGVLDTTFDPAPDVYLGVSTLIIRTNDTILGGTANNQVFRILSTGAPDNTFTNVAVGGGVFAVAEQPDGKVIIAGGFGGVQGVTRNRIARLNADGTLDESFDPGTGPTSHSTPAINDIALQPDGKIIIGGMFTNFNGVTRGSVCRLETNGAVDTSFNVGKGMTATIPFAGDFAGTVNDVELLEDGSVLIGGMFNTYQDIGATGIVRVTSSAAHDPSFNPGTGPGIGGAINVIRLLDDNRAYVGGFFTNFNGSVRQYVARIFIGEGDGGGGGGDTNDSTVASFKAPKKVTLKTGVAPKPGKLQITVTNGGDEALEISDLQSLTSVVEVVVQSLGACSNAVATLVPPKSFPILIAPKKKLKLSYTVLINCANDAAASTKTEDHSDYSYTVTIHDAEDDFPANNTCPRNPSGADPGCGGKNPDGTLGAAIKTDVVQK